MGTRSPLTYFLNEDKIESLKINLSPCLVKISYGDKIKILKIILFPCLVNISDGDMIPIDMFFLKGQDKTFKSYFVPIICKDF